VIWGWFVGQAFGLRRLLEPPGAWFNQLKRRLGKPPQDEVLPHLERSDLSKFGTLNDPIG